MSAAPFLFLAVILPLWGRLADRKGRKPMLLRTGLGMVAIIFATGFS
ncbi:MAG: hypothetical protein FWF71_07070 [Actinomycetia bacterium]|nr:hypothetical protein [Actinomycetes bacterium]